MGCQTLTRPALPAPRFWRWTAGPPCRARPHCSAPPCPSRFWRWPARIPPARPAVLNTHCRTPPRPSRFWRGPARITYASYLVHVLAIKAVLWAAEPSVYYFGSGTKPPVALLFLLGVLGRVLPGPGGAAVISAAGTAAGELVHRLVVLLALWAMVQGASLAGGCALEAALSPLL